jgi:hypothetical protein
VLCSFLDVRKRQSAIGIGDVDDLIEPCDGVTHVLCIGQRFLTLLAKGVDSVWQVALHRKPPVFLVRLPRRFCHFLLILSLNLWLKEGRVLAVAADPSRIKKNPEG